jgi:hypothetical protein
MIWAPVAIFVAFWLFIFSSIVLCASVALIAVTLYRLAMSWHSWKEFAGAVMYAAICMPFFIITGVGAYRLWWYVVDGMIERFF